MISRSRAFVHVARGVSTIDMPRRGGWRRLGRRRFRYVDSRGRPIDDEAALERIRELVIPPAWEDVWISPNAGAKLQATGVDKAGRRQYLYHPDYRAAQERAKFDRLLHFAKSLPALRARDEPPPGARPLRARLGLRDRRHARQPRMVPRRHGPACAGVTHIRHHDADEAARDDLGRRDPSSASAGRTADPSCARSRTRGSRASSSTSSSSTTEPGSSATSATARRATSPRRC